MAVLLCALGYLIVTSMRDRVIDVGDAAPDFKITTDQGKTITPTSFGGHLLVLNFFGSWCAPCIEETPSLNEFAQSMANSGVVVLGVSVDTNPKLYHNFIRRFHISYQTARDPKADISASFGTYKYPETYVIDSTGKVVQKFVGTPQPPRYWSDPELINYIRSI
jgi:peroxiredoxin